MNIALFDSNTTSAPSFRRPFDETANVKVVGVFSTWPELQNALTAGALHAVAVRLDGRNVAESLRIVQLIADLRPGCLVMGVGPADDAQAVIKAIRAGCSQFVAWPIDPSDLEQVVALAQSARGTTTPESTRICIVGAAGGTGATTLSCTLATALARVTDRSCGLVDLHLEFGDVGILCDVYPERTIADACGPATPSVPSLRGCLHEVCTNVSVLTRPQSMLDVLDIMPESIARTVRVMGHMFRYVVIDAPRSSEKVAPEVFQGADHILIVMQMMVGHIYNGIRLLERFKAQGISEDRIEFVVNRQNANYQPFTTDEVESELPKRIYASIPNDFYYISQANTLGSLCGDGMRSTVSGRAIEDLARQIAIAGLAGTSPSGPEPSCIQKLTERRTRESRGDAARDRVSRVPVDYDQFPEQRARSPASACRKP